MQLDYLTDGNHLHMAPLQLARQGTLHWRLECMMTLSRGDLRIRSVLVSAILGADAFLLGGIHAWQRCLSKGRYGVRCRTMQGEDARGDVKGEGERSWMLR